MTDTFFLISNYNTDPSYLLKYCKDYIIYDQSDKAVFDIEKKNLNYIKYENTGHNITSYFQYFIDNYDNLPPYIALLKGNIIGRHTSQIFFERVHNNKFFTYLFNDEQIPSVGKSHHLLTDNMYVELNNSWYTRFHPIKFFSNYNELLKFIYKDPLSSKYCTFSPGACYIITRENVLNNSKEFYQNLLRIINYSKIANSPAEAHIVERMLPIFFNSSYEKNPYMDSTKDFDVALNNIEPPKVKFSFTQFLLKLIK